MKRLELFEQQKEAVKYIKDFQKSEKRDVVLEGVGGTGKSTIIREVFMRKKKGSKDTYEIPSNVIGICVTHQARLNLMKSIPNSTTYAAATNMMIEFDAFGNMYFVPKYISAGFSELSKYKHIVIDECSQFSHEMIEIIRMCSSKDAKFYWMGDHHQLPPILEKGNVLVDADSPTFDFEDYYRLTEKVRQKEGEHIADLCDLICEKIDTDCSISFVNDLKTQFDTEIMKGYSIGTLESVLASFLRNFKDGVNVRITSYRNKRVEHINSCVRALLWEDDQVNRFNVGEFIVMNEQYAPIGNIPIAFNGQTFRVLSVSTVMEDNIECFLLTVNDEKKDIELLVPTAQGNLVYLKELKRLKNIALGTKRWNEYMDFKSTFANVSYAYCVTQYKIQGATLTGCYADLTDIMGCSTLSNKRKLQAFYVACSRPTNFLAIFSLSCIIMNNAINFLSIF